MQKYWYPARRTSEEWKLRSVYHTPQEVLTYEESQDTSNCNDVKEEQECVSNEYVGYTFACQDKQNMKRRNFMFNLTVHLMKISSKI